MSALIGLTLPCPLENPDDKPGFKNKLLLSKTADMAKMLGCDIYQIVPCGSSYFRNHCRSEIKLLNSKLNEYKIDMIIHSSMLLNFCNPKAQNDIDSLVNDLRDCALLDRCLGVVIHMGKNKYHGTVKEACEMYVTNVKTVLDKTNNFGNGKPPTIILETGAGVGNEVCSYLKNLGRLLRRLKKYYPQRVKICLDTAHMFSMGYDMNTELSTKKLFDKIEMYIGISNVSVIHLNDSKVPLGSRVDRHADIGFGEIILMHFVKMATEHNIPMVLETPGDMFDPVMQMGVVRRFVTFD